MLRALATSHGWDISDLDFYIIHAGGPRILSDLSKFIDVDNSMFRHSWATLTEYGNIASAVVFDALRWLFEEDTMTPDAIGVLAGFGPGITAERLADKLGDAIQTMVNRGLRVELTTASYVTGQQVISLTMVPGAKPVQVTTEGDAFVLHTALL